MLCQIKKWRVWITHVKNHDTQGLGAAAVVPGHFHLRRFDHRLTSFNRDCPATLQLQSECPFQDIDSHGKAVCMEWSLLTGLYSCCEDSHLLLLALRHPLHNFSHERRVAAFPAPGLGQRAGA